MPPSGGKLSGLPKGCREPSETKPGFPTALFNLSARFRDSRLFAAMLRGAFGVSGRLPQAGGIFPGFPVAVIRPDSPFTLCPVIIPFG